MSYEPGTWTCDRCGERVGEDNMVTLNARVGFKIRDYRGGWFGHYHQHCWEDLADRYHDLCDELREPEQEKAAGACGGDRGAVLELTRSHVERYHRRSWQDAERDAGTLDGMFIGELSGLLDHNTIRALTSAGYSTIEQLASEQDRLLPHTYRIGATRREKIKQAITAHIERTLDDGAACEQFLGRLLSDAGAT